MAKTYIDEKGYERYSGSGKLVHREVVKKQGVYLKPGFHHVHHKDGNKLNNDPKNLEVKYRSEHELDHHIERQEKRLNKKYKDLI